MGTAPKTLCPDDRYFGESAFGWASDIMAGGIFFGVFPALVSSPVWWLVLLASPIPVWIHVQQFRCEDRERFTRARIRRHECIHCGVKLDDESARSWTACGNAFAL